MSRPSPPRRVDDRDWRSRPESEEGYDRDKKADSQWKSRRDDVRKSNMGKSRHGFEEEGSGRYSSLRDGDRSVRGDSSHKSQKSESGEKERVGDEKRRYESENVTRRHAKRGYKDEEEKHGDKRRLHGDEKRREIVSREPYDDEIESARNGDRHLRDKGGNEKRPHVKEEEKEPRRGIKDTYKEMEGRRESKRKEESESESEQEKRRRKKERRRSEDLDKSRRKDHIESEDEREERRKRKKEDKRRKDKDKEKKREKKKTAASTSRWGKYGIISESDHHKKDSEFRVWLIEERQLNPETISKDRQRKEFSIFVEDYNTATLPHEKYYNMMEYEVRMKLIRSGQTLTLEADKYDPMKDEKEHENLMRARYGPRESDLTREEIIELRQIQKERSEIGKMRILGMSVPKEMGVRTKEVDRNVLFPPDPH